MFNPDYAENYVISMRYINGREYKDTDNAKDNDDQNAALRES